MRKHAIALALLPLFARCSFLESMPGSGSPGPTYAYDPTKTYLDSQHITVRRRDVDRYVCLTGPLQCQDWGNDLECTCP